MYSSPPADTSYRQLLRRLRISPDNRKMVKTSVLNDALNAINNAEKSGKRQVLIRPSSKVIVKFLSVMQKHGKSTRVNTLSRSEAARGGLSVAKHTRVDN
ncbi:unnamed protein product [Aureobasidium mustum]|uniref:Ribosomal protein S8 n=1 Tax=Aureobasidium mustum TaxID=2773714 RepID=A0A9N8KDH1_9PEZI|nr:unnamed protein product [Aureobasidium mustum]